ncbi:type I-F CRISPR-associated protein Csy2 [Acidithiobacillus ferriphilus]|uniref:type I-F CRISPR-associated protein Csy2 n=1 Tax=Acidithiobacillus ferriphilus TaxID=1689834 RepID=UPI003F5175B3
MSRRYLVIPRMRVQHVNAMQSWWLMAPPSPMTIYGFSRAMGLRCKFQVFGLAIVHHNVQWLAAEKANNRFIKKQEGGRDDKNWDIRFWNRKVVPQQPQGATFIDEQDHIESRFAKGLQPTARCHVDISVVLDIGGISDSSEHTDDVTDFLWSGRLGGGAIIEHGKVEFCEPAENVMKKVGNGFWVTDRSDLVLQAMQLHEMDGTEALTQVLGENAKHKYVYYRASAEKQAKMQKPESWLSAHVIGYAALESPKKRVGVRDGIPHAYAEPLIGLTQYRSVREEKLVPFWQYHTCPEKGVYLMKGN